MSAEDLEGFESEAQLALYQEYKSVFELFTYVVETDRRFYLTNAVEVIPQVSQGTVYYHVKMTDVWVWDVFRPSRFMKSVEVFSFHDVNVEERSANADLVVPTLSDFDS